MMAVRTHEVMCVNIEMPLQFEELTRRLGVLIDDQMLSWTVAETFLAHLKVKKYLVSQGSLADVKQQPEFLDLVILVGGSGDNYASTPEILLKDNDVLGHYHHYLHAGHLLLLRKRKLAYTDYVTYWTRQLEQMGVNADVLLALFLVIAIIVTGACFGMHSVEDTIWWQH